MKDIYFLTPISKLTVFMSLRVTNIAFYFFVSVLLVKYQKPTVSPFVPHFVTFVTLLAFFMWTIHLRMRMISASEAFEDISTVWSEVVSQTKITNFLKTKLFKMTSSLAIFALFLFSILIITNKDFFLLLRFRSLRFYFQEFKFLIVDIERIFFLFLSEIIANN